MSEPQSLVVGLPNIPGDSDFLVYIKDVIGSRRLSNNGPFLQRLEAGLAEFLEVKHCICVANATIGIEMAIRAAGVNGEVIVPSFTFVATAHAVSWMGLVPVFSDVCGHDHMIDPARVEDLVTERTGAILGVHLWGNRCAVEALEEIGASRGIPVIFDAAHAFAVGKGGRRVGGGGLCEIFSFHATKFFNTFEGGAITTDCDEFARELRLARSFGFEGMDNIVGLGTNAKMSEAHAAMGVANLPYVELLREQNRVTYELYRHRLCRLDGVKFYEFDGAIESNYQYVVVEVPPARRDPILSGLHDHNIIARRYFYPGAHRAAPYLNGNFELPVTDAVSAGILVLPAGPTVGEAEVEKVVSIIDEGLSKG